MAIELDTTPAPKVVDGHGPGCRGCMASLIVKAGNPSPDVARELLAAVGLLDEGENRVRRMLREGRTITEILEAMPGVRGYQVAREKAIIEGRLPT